MSKVNAWSFLKKKLQLFGINTQAAAFGLGAWSIRAAVKERGLAQMVEKLRSIVPDISQQEARPVLSTPFIEIKRRSLQAVQAELMLAEIRGIENPTVIDIGDSAGTHMLYLRTLAGESCNVNTISVNMDSRAIEKIRARGLTAIHSRAEDLASTEVGDVSLLTSFEMVEHLHNPCIFFRRLALRGLSNRMLISVPYLRQSRVGFHHIRENDTSQQFAEDVHIFELSPEDWSMLFLHSGWRVVKSHIHYQYPKNWPVISWLLSIFWKNYDYEGFWCAVLEIDLSKSNLYTDWEE